MLPDVSGPRFFSFLELNQDPVFFFFWGGGGAQPKYIQTTEIVLNAECRLLDL